jgi:hypothetical protein
MVQRFLGIIFTCLGITVLGISQILADPVLDKRALGRLAWMETFSTEQFVNLYLTVAKTLPRQEQQNLIDQENPFSLAPQFQAQKNYLQRLQEIFDLNQPSRPDSETFFSELREKLFVELHAPMRLNRAVSNSNSSCNLALKIMGSERQAHQRIRFRDAGKRQPIFFRSHE